MTRKNKTSFIWLQSFGYVDANKITWFAADAKNIDGIEVAILTLQLDNGTFLHGVSDEDYGDLYPIDGIKSMESVTDLEYIFDSFDFYYQPIKEDLLKQIADKIKHKRQNSK